MAFSNGSCFDHQQTQLSINFTDNIQSFTHPGDQTGEIPGIALAANFNPDGRIQKPKHTFESLGNFSPPVSANKKVNRSPLFSNFLIFSFSRMKVIFVWLLQSLDGRKRKRNSESVVEKPKEVIHVRAKRGQATDSHSLAERVLIFFLFSSVSLNQIKILNCRLFVFLTFSSYLMLGKKRENKWKVEVLTGPGSWMLQGKK